MGKTQKMSENGEIYSAGKNFTLPPALTAWTNSTSDKRTQMRARNRSQHSVGARTKMVTHKCEREIGKPQKQPLGLVQSPCAMP